jgi:hypothetical protein
MVFHDNRMFLCDDPHVSWSHTVIPALWPKVEVHLNPPMKVSHDHHVIVLFDNIYEILLTNQTNQSFLSNQTNQSKATGTSAILCVSRPWSRLPFRLNHTICSWHVKLYYSSSFLCMIFANLVYEVGFWRCRCMLYSLRRVVYCAISRMNHIYPQWRVKRAGRGVCRNCVITLWLMEKAINDFGPQGTRPLSSGSTHRSERLKELRYLYVEGLKHLTMHVRLHWRQSIHIPSAKIRT